MPPRKAIPQRTKTVAALRALAETMRVEKDGQLVPVITHAQAKRMTEDEIEAMFQWDHNVHHAIGGSIQHWNLTPMLVAQHAVKTAKRDLPQIAKTKRLEKAQIEFRRKIAAKTSTGTPETDKTGIKKPTRKMQSRGFQAWRNFKGEIVKRGKP
jgi:hypothetical protein